ncbi:MAG: cellulose synthase/poly-beta-1,6-N-acetylglucosamine synthase-like glycosyltransferase [Flavobacteriaceae bacterium]|jgi:cellulose synthase/poly-beta-1,6-N-acetylglucosamine synthase-like glycosyltransferase
MNICIIIPAYNEGDYIANTLQSLVNQTYPIKEIVVVNDNSTDNTRSIIDSFSKKHPFIKSTITKSEAIHLPGEKIINAFYFGLDQIAINEYDFIGKFDADIILPNNYFENLITIFNSNKKIGIAGGNLYIKKRNNWVFESISNKKKVRGPIKLYRKECFKQIGGLKKAIGWDTIDELLAQYHGWEIKTDESLHVKHLKPTGANYSKKAKYKQGEAFYKMRYGLLLSFIASAKLAFNKKSFSFFLNTIFGFLNAYHKSLAFIVTKKEGVFIRNLRWKGIKKKLF